MVFTSGGGVGWEERSHRFVRNAVPIMSKANAATTSMPRRSDAVTGFLAIMCLEMDVAGSGVTPGSIRMDSLLQGGKRRHP